ncbi:MAG: hypothetical protein AB1Z98_23060 [Nannocystaceae bacterium]
MALLGFACFGCADSLGGDSGLELPPPPRPDGPCDLGELPDPLDAQLRLPALPEITQEVDVATAAEFQQAAAEPGTRVRVVASIDEQVFITASDVEVRIEDPEVVVQRLAVGTSVQRVHILGGTYGQITTPRVQEFVPEPQFREEWYAEDLTIDGVLVEAALNPESVQDIALDLRAKRAAIYNSNLRGETYAIWAGDNGPFASEDLVIACSTLRAHAPAGGRNEPTVRLVSVLRSVTVDNVMQNSHVGFDDSLIDPFAVEPANIAKHNYRIHGHSDLSFAARNTLLNTGMMFGGLEDPFSASGGDEVGRIWALDNVFHHRVPDLFNPKDIIDALVARGNVAYTDVWDRFPGAADLPGWDVSDNRVEPFVPPPDGWLE